MTFYLQSIDRNRCVILILLELSAAFDMVDHTILLKRLHSSQIISIRLHMFIGLVIQHKEKDYYVDANRLKRLST